MIRKNSLVFIEDAPDHKGRKYVKCLCDCGQEKVVRKDSFNSGRQKTCGKCSRKEDLTGRKFGDLTVLKLSPKDDRFGRHWECKCECGNLTEARSYQLLQGKKITCRECYIRVDLTGRTFGNLKVNGVAYKKEYQTFWDCSCDCGQECEIPTYSLTKGYTQSCGCRKHRCKNNSPLWKGYGEISGQYWNSVIKKAHDRNYDFVIDIKYAWDLFEKQNRKCALSGIEICFPSKSYRDCEKKRLRSASLDRIDNTKGYVKGNVQWLHKDVNIMKKTHSQEYFIEICKKIAKKG